MWRYKTCFDCTYYTYSCSSQVGFSSNSSKDIFLCTCKFLEMSFHICYCAGCIICKVGKNSNPLYGLRICLIIGWGISDATTEITFILLVCCIEMVRFPMSIIAIRHGSTSFLRFPFFTEIAICWFFKKSYEKLQKSLDKKQIVVNKVNRGRGQVKQIAEKGVYSSKRNK